MVENAHCKGRGSGVGKGPPAKDHWVAGGSGTTKGSHPPEQCRAARVISHLVRVVPASVAGVTREVRQTRKIFLGHVFFTRAQLRKPRSFNALRLACFVRTQPLKGWTRRRFLYEIDGWTGASFPRSLPPPTPKNHTQWTIPIGGSASALLRRRLRPR